MYERTTYLNSELYNAFEFYVLFAMFYRGRMDWTLPTYVTRRRHSSCCTAIKAIVMYWCFLSLWYWYWLFVHDSWAVSALLSVNKIITYLLYPNQEVMHGDQELLPTGVPASEPIVEVQTGYHACLSLSRFECIWCAPPIYTSHIWVKQACSSWARTTDPPHTLVHSSLICMSLMGG